MEGKKSILKKKALEETEVTVKIEPTNDYEDLNMSIPNLNIIKEESIDIVDEKITNEYLYDNSFNQLQEVVPSRLIEGSVHKDMCIKSEKVDADRQFSQSLNKKKMLKKFSAEFSNGRYLCQYCDKSYKTKQRANRHMAHECREKLGLKTKYYCKPCNRYFITKYTLNRHTIVTHMKLDTDSEEELNSHFNKHSRYKYPCKYCDRKYRHERSLLRHLEFECGKEPRFGCAHCDMHTLQKLNLIRHLAQVHNVPEKLKETKCNKCKKTYKNACSLRRHVNFECGKKPSFKCEFCSYTTKRKYSIKVHIKNKHSKQSNS